MAQFHYKIMQHDGGWAYSLNGAFSEAFPDYSAALAAVKRVVAEQHTIRDTTLIEYQDENGQWHTEVSEGSDAPDVDVRD